MSYNKNNSFKNLSAQKAGTVNIRTNRKDVTAAFERYLSKRMTLKYKAIHLKVEAKESNEEARG